MTSKDTAHAPSMLTNVRSDRVRVVRALSGRSARQRHGQFLVEGPQGVREAVRYAAGHIRDVYFSERAAERYQEIVADCHHHGVRIHMGTPQVLDAMSDNAQEILAVMYQQVLVRTLADVLRPEGGQEDRRAGRRPLLVAVLSDVRDPGNAGTVIRTADAAGAHAVVLAGDSVSVDNPKTVRATAGSLFHIPVVTGVSLAQTIRELAAAGVCVLAADGGGVVDLDELLDVAGRLPAATDNERSDRLPDLSGPTAWVFGNEARGLSDDERGLASAVIRIPMHGLAESLNLATAAAVCLYASARAGRPRSTVAGDVTP